MIGVPSIFKLIRKPAALAMVLPEVFGQSQEGGREEKNSKFTHHFQTQVHFWMVHDLYDSTVSRVVDEKYRQPEQTDRSSVRSIFGRNSRRT